MVGNNARPIMQSADLKGSGNILSIMRVIRSLGGKKENAFSVGFYFETTTFIHIRLTDYALRSRFLLSIVFLAVAVRAALTTFLAVAIRTALGQRKK